MDLVVRRNVLDLTVKGSGQRKSGSFLKTSGIRSLSLNTICSVRAFVRAILKGTLIYLYQASMPKWQRNSGLLLLGRQYGRLHPVSVIVCGCSCECSTRTVMAFLNNWLEMRGDALKIVKHVRRPIPLRTDTVGPWIEVLVSPPKSSFMLT
jgi:hypothetical protein